MRGLLLGVLVVVLAGCGDDPELRTAGPSERQELEAAVHGWLAGIAAGDGKAACGHMTDKARDEVTEGGGSCEEAMEAISDRLVDEHRHELEVAQLSRASTQGDEASVVVSGPTEYTGQALTRTVKLERSDGEWKLTGFGLEPGDLGPIAACKIGGLQAFERGTVNAFWKQEGRADYRFYIAETCRRAADRNLLSEEGNRVALARIAGRVLLQMVHDGRVRDPR